MRNISTNILLIGTPDFNIHQGVLSAYTQKNVDINIIKMTPDETEVKALFDTVTKNVVCVFVQENYDWFYKNRKLISLNIPVIIVVYKKDHDDLYYRLGATAVISTMSWEWFYDEVEHIIDVCLYSATERFCKVNDLPIHRYTFQNTQYNPRKMMLTVNGVSHKLTRYEAYIFDYLTLNVNTELRIKDLLMHVWFNHDHYVRRSFDVIITRLRNYLKDDPTISIETSREKKTIIFNYFPIKNQEKSE